MKNPWSVDSYLGISYTRHICARLDHNTNSHALTSSFKCDLCEKVFHSEEDLKKYIETYIKLSKL